jgi:repressor of nif and glnA expression
MDINLKNYIITKSLKLFDKITDTDVKKTVIDILIEGGFNGIANIMKEGIIINNNISRREKLIYHKK